MTTEIIITAETLSKMLHFFLIFAAIICTLFIVILIQEYFFFTRMSLIDYLNLFIVYIKNGFKLGEEINIDNYIIDKRLKRRLKNTKIIVQNPSFLIKMNAYVYKYQFNGIIFINNNFFKLVKDTPEILETILWHELYHINKLGMKSDTELNATQYSLIKINERYGIIGVMSELQAGIFDEELPSFRKLSLIFSEECIKYLDRNSRINNRKFLRLR